jgi:hypothetical protein
MVVISPNRTYAQYADKPKAVAWYGIVPTVATDIYNVYEQVRNTYDIDTQSGEQLNVIGRIVVIDRSFESQLYWDPLQWGSTTSQFGGVGMQWTTSGTEINNTVSDAIFKVLIKAKISKNNNESTLDDIVEALEFITGVTPIRVVDNEDMTMSVSFGAPLNSTVRQVLNNFDIIPRPQGVQFIGYTEETAITQWGGQYGWGNERAQFGQFFGV